MSNSRKKHPFCGITTSISEKKDKRLANRAYRRAVKTALASGREPPRSMQAVSDVWCFDKDGKQRFDPERYPELMRK